MDTSKLMGLIQKASPRAAQKIAENPQILDQAIQGAKNFANNEDGVVNALHSVGAPMVDKISNTLDRYPWAKIAVNGILASNGSSIDQIKSKLNGNPSNNDSQAKRLSTPANDYKDRLSKLK